MGLKNKSLVVFHNGTVIAHRTHNKAIEEYAKMHNVEREKAFTKEHVLSMLTLIEHDIAEVILHLGEHQKCIDILDKIGINIK